MPRFTPLFIMLHTSMPTSFIRLQHDRSQYCLFTRMRISYVIGFKHYTYRLSINIILFGHQSIPDITIGCSRYKFKNTLYQLCRNVIIANYRETFFRITYQNKCFFRQPALLSRIIYPMVSQVSGKIRIHFILSILSIM